MKAIWNNAVLAESKDTVGVEGNHYFPDESIGKTYFIPGYTHAACPWKGGASYNKAEVAGRKNRDVSCYYPEPRQATRHIKGRRAFRDGSGIADQ